VLSVETAQRCLLHGKNPVVVAVKALNLPVTKNLLIISDSGVAAEQIMVIGAKTSKPG
jgi:hypothetical protein